jgi:hypothetical protein
LMMNGSAYLKSGNDSDEWRCRCLYITSYTIY